MEIKKLKNRKEFIYISNNGQKFVLGNLILLYTTNNSNLDKTEESFIRLGFVASKKIGNAVERNRAKRRLKAAVNLTIKLNSIPCYDFVLIARKHVLQSNFNEIIKDINYALRKANLYKSV